MDQVYLDRSALLAKAFTAGLCDASGNAYGSGELICVSDVMSLPAAKVFPVIHAHWIRQSATHIGYDGYTSVCSHCKTPAKSLSGALKFCPECGAKMDERTRYRYVACGLAKFSDPVCDFRLIGGTNMSFAMSAIRIRIPEDMILKKEVSDAYSTTTDTRTLEELDATPVVRINGKLKPFPRLVDIDVSQWHQTLVTDFHLAITLKGYLTAEQYRNYLAKRRLCYEPKNVF